MKGDQPVELFGNAGFAAFERRRAFIERQAVEAGAVLGCEGFEPLERTFLVEYRSVAFKRERGVENAGAAAGRFLRRARMRRAVGAEEELGRARGRRLADRQPVLLALGDRQAICVRA